MMIAFGPISSRRLGKSLGINNIPPKHCSYGCVYCQVGRTDHMNIKRKEFYPPEKIVADVKTRIEQIYRKKGQIDYLSFVPDGEPTLDIHLGEEIRLLKPLGFKIAVFTNASLIWRKDVKYELLNADWVSLKIDTVIKDTWRKIDRPYGKLSLDRILEGILAFASEFSGFLATETMLVKGLNDDIDSITEIAKFLKKLQPWLSGAYLAVPTRPPSEPWIEAPQEETIYQAYRIFKEQFDRVELLITEDETEFGFTGNAEEDLLRTTAVQPMTEEAVDELLEKDHAHWDTIHKLIARGCLREIRYRDNRFYMRRFTKRKKKKGARHESTKGKRCHEAANIRSVGRLAH